MFNKNRDRLIEHDTVTELFNSTVEMAHQKGLLSSENFSLDGILIQAWASYKSVGRKDASDEGRPPESWHSERHSNDTHESKTDTDSQLYRKSKAAPPLPSHFGNVLTDNLHGPVVNVQASRSDRFAERGAAAAMLADVAQLGKRITVGADKAYDTRGFLKACQDGDVIPQVPQNTYRVVGSAIDAHATGHAGYAISHRKRKSIEQCFGWGKLIGPMLQVMVRGLDKVDLLLTPTMAVYNLTRLRTLAPLRSYCT